MKDKLKKGIIIYGVIFLLLFILRIIYGYRTFPDNQNINPVQQMVNQEVSQISYNKKNIASSKIVYQKGKSQITVDQKYEKIASLSSYSKNFDKDEKNIRKIIKSYSALIQHENNSGLKGKRALELTIGVDPKKFDLVIKDIEKIGTLTSKYITKIDKTNEYKNLNAKRKSLIKKRNSLLKLKGRSGKIDEFITLENEIFTIEEKIQNLGVDLGEYDSENEFCTVKFILNEFKIHKASIPLFKRFKTAFEWSVKYYFFITLSLFFACVIIILSTILLDKLKVLSSIIKKLEKK